MMKNPLRYHFLSPAGGYKKTGFAYIFIRSRHVPAKPRRAPSPEAHPPGPAEDGASRHITHAARQKQIQNHFPASSILRLNQQISTLPFN
ncbi:hypothetical protein A2U01_0060391 [Trifolium medium]|uniref:Uncharacterized protein n=1 Tax=Trifolium medium TaxID=97028 RepID=A0A392RTP5_9FABA|nr:hypothetical protein [Trifolium medium]